MRQKVHTRFQRPYQASQRRAEGGEYIENVADSQQSSTPSVSTAFVEPQMVKVEGGTFQMSCQTSVNEKPNPVTLSDFYIGKYEVTQAEWRSVMDEDPKELADFKGDNMPVHTVNWDDIQAFLQKINAQTGKQYRLPSEAEWEFAARGGNESKVISIQVQIILTVLRGWMETPIINLTPLAVELQTN